MSKTILFTVLVAAVLASVVAMIWQTKRPPVVDSAMPAQVAAVKPATVARAAYVGGASCAVCHAEQFEQWQGSHHDLAMQEVSAHSVLGDFTTFERGSMLRF